MSLQRNIRLLTIFNFCTDFVLYAPVAIIYFTKVTGSFALGMSVFSVVMVSAAVFQIPTGIFSDLQGRRKTLIMGAASASIAAIFYAIGMHYWILLLGSVFAGLARSFYSGNNDALLYETLAEHHKEKEFHYYSGKTSAMFQAALALAAILGGIIANWSFAAVMWLSVIPQCIALAVSFFFIEPKKHIQQQSNGIHLIKEAIQQLAQNSKLRLLTITSVLRYALGESMYQFKATFVQLLWPVWAIGFSNVLSNILGTIAFYVSGKIIHRFSGRTILNFEIIFNRVANFVALLFPSVLSPALMSATSFTYCVACVAEGALMQQEFTDKQRATLGSLGSLLGSLVFAVVAFSLGGIADHIGPQKTLIIVNTLLLTPLFFYWQIFKHPKKQQK
jgi:MFS family permease